MCWLQNKVPGAYRDSLTLCKETHGVVKFAGPKVTACRPGSSSGEPSWVVQAACLFRAR